MCDLKKADILTESGSTEDVLAAIDRYNYDPIPGTVIGKMDVTALYPSLSAQEDSEVVRKLVEKYFDMVQDVQWNEVSFYLTLTHTPNELSALGLTEFCHSRKFSRGQLPGITTEEVTTPLGSEILDKQNKLNPPKFVPREVEKAKMLGALVARATLEAMTRHTYCFDGKTRIQSKRGPIGNTLAGAVVRAVMLDWDLQRLDLIPKATSDLDITTALAMLHKKYVDDQLGAHKPMPPGYRWDPQGSCIKFFQELVVEDKTLEPNKRTMLVLCKSGHCK